MGCLFGLFTLPRAFYYWVRENGVKGYIVAAVLVFIIIVSVMALQSAIRNNAYTGEATYSEQLLAPGPDRADAPYKVVTDTRVYYAFIAIVNDDSTVTMTNYYELNSGEWLLTEGVLVLDENYGTVQVTKRPLHE